MQVKEPTFSVSNMFTFNSQQYFKYFDSFGSYIYVPKAVAYMLYAIEI